MSSTTATAAASPPSSSTEPPNATTRNEAKPIHDDPKEAARLCDQWVASGIANQKSIQFLLKTLLDSGCTPPDHFIRCAQCVQPQAGGFGMLLDQDSDNDANVAVTSSKVGPVAVVGAIQHQQRTSCQRTAQDIKEQLERAAKNNNNKNAEGGSGTTGLLKLVPDIFVCQQYMENEAMVHRTVHHELIHAIDLCRTNMDPVTNCVQLACTEIRAENLSGECRFWKELPLMKKFAGHGSACVERRAILSVRANPNCTDRAEEYVKAAMPRCSRDYFPYDRHPNEK
jgi:mitochondrial inner membrane protease ATP23